MAIYSGSGVEPRTIKASEFKATCLRLMDEVAENGDEIVITKNGHPTARLVPCRKQFRDWFGADRRSIEILGDIISPIDPESEPIDAESEAKDDSGPVTNP